MIQTPREWLTRVNDLKTWSKFDDFHLDELKSIKVESERITKSFDYLNEAIKTRDLIAPNLLILLAFPLRSGTTYSGITFKTLEQIGKLQTMTPPTLYAFPIEFENFIMSIKESLKLEQIKGIPVDVTGLYLEYLQDGDEEFRRSVFFIKNGDLNKIREMLLNDK